MDSQNNSSKMSTSTSTTSKELNVIGIAIESIKNDDLNQLDRALRIMPIEKIKDPNETLLTNFLSLCAAYNRADASKMVLERWKVVYPDNDKIPIFSRLFLKHNINDSTLAYLVSIHPEYTYVELIDDLAEFDSSQQVMLACVRAEKIFGKQKHHTYLILREHARDFENYVVEEYMVDKIAETADYTEVPKYIKNYVGEYYPEYKDKLPTETELVKLAEPGQQDERDEDVSQITDDAAVEMLTQGLANFGISFLEIEATKKFLKEEISSSEERKKELLSPILENNGQKALADDRLLLWTFGPSNPLVNQDLTIDAPSYKYGGCRMLITDLFDYDEENDYVVDWFTGNCQHCLLKIKHKWHAVRQPRSMGGWVGCYCSWKCLREEWNEREDFNMEEDLLTEKLIDLFQKKTEEVGIQDRLLNYS